MNTNRNGLRRAARRSVAGLVVAAMAALAAPLAWGDVGGGPARVEDPRPGASHGVLPAQAQPFGYSLAQMSRLIAPFNVGDRTGPPPNSPFQLLYVNTATQSTTFTVRPGTFLYVPVVFSDNSLPIIGNFPASVENRRQLLRYWFSQTEFGAAVTEVIIDGKAVPLGAGHVQGAVFAQPLANGATQYISASAFVAPLPPGTHSVGIHAKVTGDALRDPPFDQFFPDGIFEFSFAYTVVVR